MAVASHYQKWAWLFVFFSVSMNVKKKMLSPSACHVVLLSILAECGRSE